VLLLAVMSVSARSQDAEFSAAVGRIKALSAAGKDKEAEAVAERLIARTKEKEGEESLNVALAMEWLADVYANQSRHKEQLDVLQQALAMRKKLMPPNDPLLGSKYHNVASALLELQRVKEAVPLLQKALEIREKTNGPDHLKTAEALEGLANAQGSDYSDSGSFRKYETLMRRALDIRVKAAGPESYEVGQTLREMGEKFGQTEREQEAERLFGQALTIFQKLGNKVAVARVLGAQSELYSQQGRLSEATAMLERALPLIEQWARENRKQALLARGIVAEAMSNLGQAYFNEGRFEEDLALQERALAIQEQVFGKQAPGLALYLRNSGLVYHAVGRLDDAARMFDRQIAAISSGAGSDTSEFGEALMYRADVARAQGRFAEAIDFAKRARDIFERMFHGKGQPLAIALGTLGRILVADNRPAEAKPLLERARSLLVKASGNDNPITAATVTDLAAAECAMGDTGGALTHAREAAAIFTKRTENGLSGSGPNKREFYSAGAYSTLVCAALGEATKNAGQREQLAGEALVAAQREDQTVAAEALARMAARASASTPEIAGLVRTQQDLAARAQALDRQINRALVSSHGPGDSARVDRLRKTRAENEVQLAAAVTEIARRAPNLAALANPKPLSVAEVRGLIKPDEALIAFLIRPEGGYVWGITREGVAFARIESSAATIAGKVSALRKSFELEEGKAALGFDPVLAHELYTALIGPVEGVVGTKPNWLVVASGPLTGLPLHVLVTDKPTAAVASLADYRNVAWLAKRHAVTTLPGVASLNALRVLAKITASSKPLKGYADPVFSRATKPTRRSRTAAAQAGDARGYASYFRGGAVNGEALAKALQALPESADELKAVAQKFNVPDSDIHLGNAATEIAVKSAKLDDYRIVYFATHGLVAGEIEGLGEPALVLSLPRAASTTDDGLLTASEVAQLKLNAEWVVLSACNTAAGDKPGAEALSGLARAFFYAGARALLVSHWPVGSKAATRLAIATFEALQSNPRSGRSQALQKAMLEMIEDPSDPWNAHPALWAPFVVVGEGGVVR
jgi:CHAT domain-containing protein